MYNGAQGIANRTESAQCFQRGIDGTEQVSVFAEKAKQENHPEVAELFEKMAQNEGMHGKLLYHYLKGVGGTAENLREAVDGEYGEWSRMYPEFARIAREEGFEAIGKLFDEITKIERDHEGRFLMALAKLHNPSVDTSKPEAAPKNSGGKHMVTVSGYRCMFCGATYEHRPNVCPVCQAIGSFESTTIQKEMED